MKRPPYSIKHRRRLTEDWDRKWGREDPELRAWLERSFAYQYAELLDAQDDFLEALRDAARRVVGALTRAFRVNR